jgi:hypothetical protein
MNETNIILFPTSAIKDPINSMFRWDDIKNPELFDFHDVHSFPSIQLNAYNAKHGYNTRCETDLGKIVDKYSK